MAVRFDAGTDSLSRATPPSGDYTLAMWASLTNNRANFSMLSSIDNGGGDYIQMGTNGGGAALVMYTDFDGATEHAVGATLGATWTFAAYTLATAGNGTIIPYYGTPGSALTTASSFASGANSGTLRLGNSGFGEWFDGRIANVIIWDRVLSAAELALQMRQYVPISTSGLHLWAPLLRHTELVDFSGNGRTLSSAGTLTTEDGPPIPWGPPRVRRFYVPAAASNPSGTVAVSTSSASAAVAGTPVHQGAVAVSTLSATVAVAGHVVPVGTVAVSPVATMSSAGTSTIPGEAAVSTSAAVAVAGSPVNVATVAVGPSASVAAAGVLGDAVGAVAVATSASVAVAGAPVVNGTVATSPTASVAAVGLVHPVGSVAVTTAGASVAAGNGHVGRAFGRRYRRR